MNNKNQNTPSALRTQRARRLRRWFLGGFLIVFVGMLLLLNQYFYAGEAIVSCKLWWFYIKEIERVFTTSGALSPTTGSGTEAFTTFLQHVAISVVGGLVSLGAGKLLARNDA